jgi:hypothetical protein
MPQYRLSQLRKDEAGAWNARFVVRHAYCFDRRMVDAVERSATVGYKL